MSSPAVPRHRPASGPARSDVAAAGGLPGGDPTAPAVQPTSPVAGRWRLDPATDGWWSPEMYDVLGLAATVRPGTDQLLRCFHPDDQTRVLDALTRVSVAGRPAALEGRVVRPDGSVRVVAVLAEPDLDATGAVTAVEGLLIDLTEGRPDADRVQALETEVTQLRTAMSSRAAIEQAKGILMLLTSCSDQVAFDLLAHISSHTHRKVRDVANAITDSASGRTPLPDDVRAILRDACPPQH